MTVQELWGCYGNDQGIQTCGKTKEEALGCAILQIVECYKGDTIGFVIDKIMIGDEPIVMPVMNVGKK